MSTAFATAASLGSAERSPWSCLRAFSICTSSLARFNGNRIMRDFSHTALRIACRIHHTA